MSSACNGARAAGRAIGATADGYIDRPQGTLALKGSLVPAYGVNSVLSNIPLLGDLLASKKGEGILGVTYSATGNVEQPNISTNPLSMLTPGIFRRIFEGHMPTGDAPTNAPVAAQPTQARQITAAAPRPGVRAINMSWPARAGHPCRSSWLAGRAEPAMMSRLASPARASFLPLESFNTPSLFERRRIHR